VIIFCFHGGKITVDRGGRVSAEWKWRIFSNPTTERGRVMTVFQSLSRAAIVAVVTLFTLVPAVTAEERESGAVGPSAVIVPSLRTVSFNLAPGGITPAIVLPSNTPVQLIGITTTLNFRGVGQASLLGIPGAGGFVEWVGLDSTAGAAITQGFSGVAGTKILFIDFSHQVRVEVAGPNAIRVHNLAAAPRAGRLSLMW
jgi:hypothetical protein